MCEKILDCFMMEITPHYCREHKAFVRGKFVLSVVPLSPTPQHKKRGKKTLENLYILHTISFVKMSACCHYGWKGSVVYWSSGQLFSLSWYLWWNMLHARICAALNWGASIFWIHITVLYSYLLPSLFIFVCGGPRISSLHNLSEL